MCRPLKVDAGERDCMGSYDSSSISDICASQVSLVRAILFDVKVGFPVVAMSSIPNDILSAITTEMSD